MFGPIHGAMFVAYVITVVVAWRLERWSLARTALGLVSAVPPFMTVWFERRVTREWTPAAAAHHEVAA